MEVKEDKKDLAEIIVQYSRNLTHVFYKLAYIVAGYVFSLYVYLQKYPRIY